LAQIFWLFLIYSFLGYLLEKIFAVLTHAKKTVRKCFFLLPLCPVYGLGVLAVLALPPILTDHWIKLALWGSLAATAVEYAVHWWYEAVFEVKFWDYADVTGNLQGRVCLPFSIAWGVLLAAFLPWLQPWLAELTVGIPAVWTLAAWLLFVIDVMLSMRILWRYGDTEMLSARNLRNAA